MNAVSPAGGQSWRKDCVDADAPATATATAQISTPPALCAEIASQFEWISFHLLENSKAGHFYKSSLKDAAPHWRRCVIAAEDIRNNNLHRNSLISKSNLQVQS
jgi:hypothetical protein